MGNLAKVDALVVKKPLDFDMLFGYDAIKSLGGVLITQDRNVQFQEAALMCATLKIDHPDFSVRFEERQKHWIASWK